MRNWTKSNWDELYEDNNVYNALETFYKRYKKLQLCLPNPIPIETTIQKVTWITTGLKSICIKNKPYKKPTGA